MSKPKSHCSRCQHPRRRPGVCNACMAKAIREQRAQQPTPKMSPQTSRLLALLGGLSVQFPGYDDNDV